MMRARHWSIAQVPGKTEWRLAEVSGGKGDLSFFSAISEHANIPYTCKGAISLCFAPQEYYLYTDQFPELKPELLALQIDKRFKDQGLTMDSEGFAHRAKQLEEKNGTINCLFVRQQVLNDLYHLILPWKGIKKLRLVPLAAAVAGLMRTVTDQGVIVLFLGKRVSQVLAVRNGAPLYSQTLTQATEGMVEEALIPHAIDFARHSVRRQYNVDMPHIVRLGPCRESINLGELNIGEWLPDFSTVCRSQSPEDVFLFPGVYGAVFADDAYDFLPREFTGSWKIQTFSKITATIAAFLAAGLFGGWLYLQPVLAQLKVQYHTLLGELTEGQRKITQHMPDTAVLDNFDRLVNIRAQAGKDYRLDILTRRISVALPPQVQITSLEVRRIAPDANADSANIAPPPEGDAAAGGGLPVEQAAGATSLSMPERLQAEHVKVTLAAVTSGSHDEITGRFQKAILGLNRYFTVQDMIWTYREADRTGILKCVFAPLEKGGDS